uniref:Uncharacterized protein n=1 Tax=Candidatus Kentrum sp. UNK TaxID=2126344 RepID=A0A451AQ93_9GAMM|nr:MAG: hypothetical protein BECKUNK1418G_GA0071005_12116 [Candidatus Kentron sp. UNK]VFK73005.1 MAG: hypothetical protein BECKUNK1418H_GA0071006_115610 [Candidatus Kentron sp. UNK]
MKICGLSGFGPDNREIYEAKESCLRKHFDVETKKIIDMFFYDINKEFIIQVSTMSKINKVGLDVLLAIIGVLFGSGIIVEIYRSRKKRIKKNM